METRIALLERRLMEFKKMLLVLLVLLLLTFGVSLKGLHDARVVRQHLIPVLDAFKTSHPDL
jgi:hypothetical protein